MPWPFISAAFERSKVLWDSHERYEQILVYALTSFSAGEIPLEKSFCTCVYMQRGTAMVLSLGKIKISRFKPIIFHGIGFYKPKNRQAHSYRVQGWNSLGFQILIANTKSYSAFVFKSKSLVCAWDPSLRRVHLARRAVSRIESGFEEISANGWSVSSRCQTVVSGHLESKMFCWCSVDFGENARLGGKSAYVIYQLLVIDLYCTFDLNINSSLSPTL